MEQGSRLFLERRISLLYGAESAAMRAQGIEMSIFRRILFFLRKYPKQVKSNHKRIKMIKCPHCRGSGQIMKFVDDELGVSYSSGSAVGGGRYEFEVCSECNGAGYISQDFNDK